MLYYELSNKRVTGGIKIMYNNQAKQFYFPTIIFVHQNKLCSIQVQPELQVPFYLCSIR